jgi:hypothetical protein
MRRWALGRSRRHRYPRHGAHPVRRENDFAALAKSLPIETITELPLPDADALNGAIPEAEWELGIDGKPRPPWQLNYVVYLLNPHDASVFTSINATTGQRIAFERLVDKMKFMRALRFCLG